MATDVENQKGATNSQSSKCPTNVSAFLDTVTTHKVTSCQWVKEFTPSDRLQWALICCSPEMLTYCIEHDNIDLFVSVERLRVGEGKTSTETMDKGANLPALPYFLNLAQLLISQKPQTLVSRQQMRQCVDVLLDVPLSERIKNDPQACQSWWRQLVYSAVFLPVDIALAPILSRGPHWRLKRVAGETLIQWCARHLLLDSAKWLHQHKHIKWTRDAFGRTALHYACGTPGCPLNNARAAAFVQWLVAVRPSLVNVQDRGGETALHTACIYNQVEAVRVLSAAKANPNLLSGSDSALTYAIHDGLTECVELLLNAGSCRHPLVQWDKTANRPAFRSLARIAAVHGHTQLEKRLLSVETLDSLSPDGNFACDTCGFRIDKFRYDKPLSSLSQNMEQCHNPKCLQLQTEIVQLVKPKPASATAALTTSSTATVVSLKKCGRCLAAGYCSVECQKAHWHVHRLQCEARRAAP